MNNCNWLLIGKTSKCGKKCRNQYCGIHMNYVRRGSTGPKPCIVCSVGVRGKNQLCVAHGGKKYRDHKFYFDTHQHVKHFAAEMKSPQEYVEDRKIIII